MDGNIFEEELDTLKTVLARCPVCKKTITFNVKKEIIEKTKQDPVPVIIEHCESSLLVHIDKYFKVRGIHIVPNLVKMEKKENIDYNEDSKNNITSKILSEEEINNLPREEKIIYSYNLGPEFIKSQKIPDIREKFIIMFVSKEVEVSLNRILNRLPILEKALNKKVNSEKVIDILDKYVKKGFIKKEIIGEL